MTASSRKDRIDAKETEGEIAQTPPFGSQLQNAMAPRSSA